MGNERTRGWRFTNEQRAKGLRFLAGFEPQDGVEIGDKKIMEYVFVENMAAANISKLNDPDIVSFNNRSKGRPLSGSSILERLYKYFPELRNKEPINKPKSGEERIALMKERRQQASKHIRQCAFCGTKERLEEHHMIPISMGGTNDELNLIFLCYDCHKAVTSYQQSGCLQKGNGIGDKI